MGLRKGYQYPNANLICQEPGCGRTFKNPQSLLNHSRAHMARADTTAPSGTKESDTIARLQEEIKFLRLSGEKRRLEATSTPIAPAIPDVAELSGMGKMQPEIAAAVQSRAFSVNAPPQPANNNWNELLQAIKVFAEISRSNQHDSSLSLLKELGISLKDLVTKTEAPQANGLKIGTLDLKNVRLTEPVVTALINYQEKLETAEKESISRAAASESLNKLTTTLVDLFGPWIQSKIVGNGSSGITSRPAGRVPPMSAGMASAPQHFMCAACNNPVEIPIGAMPGQKIVCSCGEEYTIEPPVDNKPQSRQMPQTVPVIEPEKIFMACKCGQQLDVTNIPLLAEIKCPVCGAIAKVTDPDTPLPAREITQQEKYQTLYDKNNERRQ